MKEKALKFVPSLDSERLQILRLSCCDIFVVEASFGIRNFNMHSALDIGCVVHIRR